MRCAFPRCVLGRIGRNCVVCADWNFPEANVDFGAKLVVRASGLSGWREVLQLKAHGNPRPDYVTLLLVVFVEKKSDDSCSPACCGLSGCVLG